MRMLWIAGSALLPLLAMGCQDEAKPEPAAAEGTAAASRGIGVFAQLVTEQNYKAMGFASVEEAKTATLGPPLAVQTVGLDRLKAYEPGDDPAALFSESNDTFYPVMVGDSVRSSITVTRQEAGFVPSAFGNAEVAQLIGRYRTSTDSDQFVVRIPALLMFFLAQRTEEQITLTPIVSDQRAGLVAGQPLPADRVFAQLVPVAQAYNELPM